MLSRVQAVKQAAHRFRNNARALLNKLDAALDTPALLYARPVSWFGGITTALLLIASTVTVVLTGFQGLNGVIAVLAPLVAPMLEWVFLPLSSSLTFAANKGHWPRSSEAKEWGWRLTGKLQLVSLFGLGIGNLIALLLGLTYQGAFQTKALVLSGVPPFFAMLFFGAQVAFYKAAERALPEIDAPEEDAASAEDAIPQESVIVDRLYVVVFVVLFAGCFLVPYGTVVAVLLGMNCTGLHSPMSQHWWSFLAFQYRKLVFLYGSAFVPVLENLLASQVTMIVNYRLREGHLPSKWSQWSQLAREALSNLAFIGGANLITYGTVLLVTNGTTLQPLIVAFVIIIIVRELLANVLYIPTVVLLASVGKSRDKSLFRILKDELRCGQLEER